MQKRWRRRLAITALLLGVGLPTLAAMAAAAGWSVWFDPRQRAFLSYSLVKDGPRALLLACLRDVDMFTIASEDVADAHSIGQKATLTLANGATRYAVDGEIARDPTSGTPSFSVDIDLDAQTVRQLRDGLFPVLEGKAPIELSIGSAHRELPLAGLPDALKRFKATCFGRR